MASSAVEDDALGIPPHIAAWLRQLEPFEIDSTASACSENNISEELGDKLKLGKDPFSLKTCEYADLTIQNIKQDALRTFSDLGYFNEEDSSGFKELEEVLLRLATAFPEIGYCQGMNFIAGYLLFSLRDIPSKTSVDCCFRLVHGIFCSEKHDLRANFEPGMLQTQIRVFQFENLFKRKLTSLHLHLNEQGVSSEYFVMTFLLPLFTSKLPFSFLGIFFPLFFSNGWPVAFSSLLFILGFFKEKLLCLDPPGISKFFSRGNPILEELCCESLVFRLENTFKVSQSELDSLEAEFISNKLGINTKTLIKGEDILEQVQVEITSFNMLTKCDSISLQDKIEEAEKDKEHFNKVHLHLAAKVMTLELEIDDHKQARTAIIAQIDLLRNLEQNLEDDILLLEEKLSWVCSELGEKTSLFNKLQPKLMNVRICLEESLEKKKAFSQQLLHIVTSAEQQKQEKLKQLKHLV